MGATVRTPQVFFVFSANETLKIDTPQYIQRMGKIQRREWNFYGYGPSIRCNARVGGPHTIPSRIEISSEAPALLLDD